MVESSEIKAEHKRLTIIRIILGVTTLGVIILIIGSAIDNGILVYSGFIITCLMVGIVITLSFKPIIIEYDENLDSQEKAH